MNETLGWIRARAIPLATVEAGNGFADLARVFGIEASYPESLRVNDYVLHGTGNPAEALAGMRFWTWDTQEVLALIEWMRAWNRTHERKVKFYGFDMQSPTE